MTEVYYQVIRPPRVWSNLTAGVAVKWGPMREGSRIYGLSVTQDRDAYVLPMGQDEDVRGALVATGTNVAYAMVCRVYEQGTQGVIFDRVERIDLPRAGEPVGLTRRKTVLWHQEVGSESHRWISKLIAVSSDGRVLTMEEGFPERTDGIRTEYGYREVIYDVEGRRFVKREGER